MYDKKRNRYNRANLILLVLAVIAVIFAAIYIPVTASGNQSKDDVVLDSNSWTEEGTYIYHDGNQVQISVTSVRSESSGYYYVYTTYCISNYSDAEICYVSWQCDVYDESTGSRLGYLTGSVGDTMSSRSALHLAVGESTEVEAYVSSSSLSYGSFFTAMYQSGMNGLTYVVYPVSVYFSDGVSWSN